MSILDKLLKKRGITTDQLDEEERKTYDTWRKILSKEELTIAEVKEFCQAQIEAIEAKWRDLDKENIKKAELIPYHTVYKLLLITLDAPKVAREQLEQQLNQLIQ